MTQKNSYKFETMPEKITGCLLECVLMPNGEIISMGKQIGFFKDYKEHLFNGEKMIADVARINEDLKKLL
jgi:hypothetical protein